MEDQSQLCNTCSKLCLKRGSFVIDSHGFPNRRLTPEALTLANEKFKLGKLERIRTGQEKCGICALVSHTASGTDIPKEAECYLMWEIDGHYSATVRGVRRRGGGRLTRRLRICWENQDFKDHEAYMVLVAPPSYDEADLDYIGLLNKETQFLGRRLGVSETKKNLIREFLRLCETHHPEHCRRQLGIESAFIDTLSEPYFGVIDIENDQLVPLPFSRRSDGFDFQRYATVSYCWGTGNDRGHTTNKGNIQSRRKSGGLASVIKQLPKALRQSIRLVQGIGIRYIWIDALCIVQDSSHSWNLNARAMHLIYGNSTITICAADGDDASAGLVALGKNDPSHQQIKDCGSGVTLSLHKPPEIGIETSAWNKRAWTFQERLLSKRCLIFTGGQIYFQCRSTGMSEDIFADKAGAGWSLDLVRAPLQMLSQLEQRAMWFYMQCVYLYTRRTLYEPFDTLAAFMGMTKLMEIYMHGSFIFGLPTSHFDLALLWEPIGKSVRLEKPLSADDPRYKDLRFPSWSWCGWKSDGVSYKHDLIGGCTDDVQAWLTNHTWIDWRVRDGHGTLRYVWDKRGSVTSCRNQKWRGYSSNPNEDGIFVAASSPDDRYSDVRIRKVDSDHSWNPVNERRLEVYNPSPRPHRERPHPPLAIRMSPEHSAAGFAPPEPPPPNEYDHYGRQRLGATMSESSGRNRHQFHHTLPEDPYHVNFSDDSWEKAMLHREFPDQPFLQFFTWHARLHVVRAQAFDNAAEAISPGPAHTAEEDMQRCHIIDWRGDKCGSLLVGNEWLKEQEEKSQTEFTFIAISNAKSFTLEELPYWSYYIPKERHESEWDLYFVLLVTHYPNEGVYRRVAIGKVFKDAFAREDEDWKEIILG